MSERPANDPTEEMPGDFRVHITLNSEILYEDQHPGTVESTVEGIRKMLYKCGFTDSEFEITITRESF